MRLWWNWQTRYFEGVVLVRAYNKLNTRSWWNWQTRYFEGVVLVWECEFKSHRPHKISPIVGRAFLVPLFISARNT